MYKRLLNIDLPEKQSAFLWGARKTGKSTFLKMKFPDNVYVDLLLSDNYMKYLNAPQRLREELNAVDTKILNSPIIIDEVQKIPQLLDEIHWLIENKGLNFILSGSSARKLKRGKANLLGGRAWRFTMLPLTSKEIGEFNLLDVLNKGLIPSHYLSSNYKKSLKAYIHDYLKEEVFDEGLTRNIPAFSRFFDSIGYSLGELTNYANIARECGVNEKTVKEYYQILIDTLLGTLVEPFKKRQERQVIQKAGKFYLFDVGVAGAISKRNIIEEKGELFGKAFEHFIFMEINAFKLYNDFDFEINFWRTKSGEEVDFILNSGEIAIEVKGSSNIGNQHLKGLIKFKELHNTKKTILVCNEKTPRITRDIEILPVRIFLEKLWNREIV
ncbi:MAG: AAA family ATPase [Candidatus Kapaibacterium sp.]